MDKTLLGLFTSFVGRREFALSVVETTCLEETLFKVVRRACMRKTAECFCKLITATGTITRPCSA